MRVFLFIFLFILIILFLPITFKVKIDYDVLKNTGIIVFYIFGIRIFIKKWKVGINKIIFIAKNNKKSEMILFDFDGESKYTDYLIKEIVRQLELNTLKLFVTVGVEEYAMYTAIIDYALRLPTNILFNVIDKVKNPKKLVCRVLPDFYRSNLFFAIATSITLSIVMVVVSGVKAYFEFRKRKRKFVYGKRNTN